MDGWMKEGNSFSEDETQTRLILPPSGGDNVLDSIPRPYQSGGWMVGHKTHSSSPSSSWDDADKQARGANLIISPLPRACGGGGRYYYWLIFIYYIWFYDCCIYTDTIFRWINIPALSGRGVDLLQRKTWERTLNNSWLVVKNRHA